MSNIATEKAADAIIVIDVRAKLYADQRAVLAGFVTDFKDAQEKLLAKHLPAIRKAAARCAELRDNLHHEIAGRPSLFVKPRTMTLHGVKVGMKKGTGALEWDDDEVIVARIRKHCPVEQHATLIQVTEKPVVDALKQLDVKLLAKLGITVEATGDCVVIKAADSEVDKAVKAILKEVSQPVETPAS